jgi:hypothetical protein
LFFFGAWRAAEGRKAIASLARDQRPSPAGLRRNIRYDALDKICGISLITTTAWHLFKGGPVNLTQNVILTRSDLIKFAN